MTFGQETEYVIRYATEPEEIHPGNRRIFKALKSAIEQLVPTQTGFRDESNLQFFILNGGAFYYEMVPHAPDGGLIEGATPECATPDELIACQRAQETLLIQAIPIAQEELAREGFTGPLSLLKNCRDAEGHIYGAQENYQVPLGSPLERALFFIMATLTMIPSLLCILAIFLTVPILVVFLLSTSLLYLLLFFALSTLQSWFPSLPLSKSLLYLIRIKTHWSHFLQTLETNPTMGRFFAYAVTPIQYLICGPFVLLTKWIGFADLRRDLTAFFLTRTLFTGAGALLPTNEFLLSEKGSALTGLTRTVASWTSRVIYDHAHFLKNIQYASFEWLKLRSTLWLDFLQPNQRLQIGLSDANRCQTAEYLKIATTALVLEMILAKALPQAPRMKHPIRSFRETILKGNFQTPIPLKNSSPLNALQIQWQYYHAAEKFQRLNPQAPPHHHKTLLLWKDVLTKLETDPQSLIGQVDWITKKHLLESAQTNLSYETRKIIDLRYHELATGYFDPLERHGIAPILIGFEAIETATHTPPSPLTAQRRSAWIRESHATGLPTVISWNFIRIGTGLQTRTLSLREDHPEHPPSTSPAPSSCHPHSQT